MQPHYMPQGGMPPQQPFRPQQFLQQPQQQAQYPTQLQYHQQVPVQQYPQQAQRGMMMPQTGDKRARTAESAHMVKRQMMPHHMAMPNAMQMQMQQQMQQQQMQQQQWQQHLQMNRLQHAHQVTQVLHQQEQQRLRSSSPTQYASTALARSASLGASAADQPQVYSSGNSRGSSPSVDADDEDNNVRQGQWPQLGLIEKCFVYLRRKRLDRLRQAHDALPLDDAFFPVRRDTASKDSRSLVLVTHDTAARLDDPANTLGLGSKDKLAALDMQVASFLAPLMESGLVQASASVNVLDVEELKSDPRRLVANCSVSVQCLAVNEKQVYNALRRMRWAPNVGRVVTLRAEAAMEKQRLQAQKTGKGDKDSISIDHIVSNFLQVFSQVLDHRRMRPMQPHKSVRAKLLPYQKVGLSWLTEKERQPSALSFFWVQRRAADGVSMQYHNTRTKQTLPVGVEPPDHRGGILADDMGLGKTVQTISLICTNTLLHANMSAAEIERRQRKEKKRIASAGKSGSSTFVKLPGPTLIVAPLTVMSNWEEQIRKHTQPDTLKVYVYHHNKRNKSPDFLRQHHVVITTYTVVQSEFAEFVEGTKRARTKKSSNGSNSGTVEKKKPKRKVDVNENVEVETRPADTGLHAINWLRVVLDEGHEIRNRETRTFRACCNLRARYRWALTGTPVQNKLNDLFALLRFLRVQPFGLLNTWRALVVEPLQQKKTEGMDNLRKILDGMCLRRSKDMQVNGRPIVRLPQKTIRVIRVQFDATERKMYDKMFAYYRKQFRAAREQGSNSSNSRVLGMLLRLRQCCGHLLLVPAADRDAMLSASAELRKQGITGKPQTDTKNNVNNITRAWVSDQLERHGECLECFDDPVQPQVVVPCGHVFCKKCLDEQKKNNRNCPACMGNITREVDVASFFSKDDEDAVQSQSGDKDRLLGGHEMSTEHLNHLLASGSTRFFADSSYGRALARGRVAQSAKIRALISEIRKGQRFRSTGGSSVTGGKCVVFSQWTKMLDLVETCLSTAGIRSVRLDGSMKKPVRDRALRTFAQDPSVKVFLLSLKAGNLGLNLVAANRVFILDPWWNPATEDQAVDRVHRLGQKLPVTVTRFVVAETVEEKILLLQEKKRRLIEGTAALATILLLTCPISVGAFGQLSKEQIQKIVKADLSALMQ
ncbi:MAG: hypothetical protein MHM6MM_000004 [Cercozoa sp. M6MM]